MKNLLLAVFFLLAVSGPAFAHAHYAGGQDCAVQAQQEIAPSLAYRICNAAQAALYPHTGMTTSQLYEAYQDGMVVITYLGTDPADPHKSLYRVSAGGGETIIGIVEGL
jgi:hypothetical protein